jgi:hypothetical protein
VPHTPILRVGLEPSAAFISSAVIPSCSRPLCAAVKERGICFLPFVCVPLRCHFGAFTRALKTGTIHTA